MTEAVTAPAATAATPEVGFKVFIGNLAFATKDQDLQQLCAPTGQITSATVIHRGARSLGYGFVTYVSESEARAAVQSLDKSELAGRQINVELAKPNTTPREPRERAVRPPRAKVATTTTTTTTEGHVNGGENGEVTEGGAEGEEPVRARKPRAKRTKASRRPRTDLETEEAGDAPLESLSSTLASTTLSPRAASTDAPTAPRAPRTRKPRSSPPSSEPRPPRRVGPPVGTESKTTLFAANLGFTIDDAALLALFDGFKVVSVRVVMKKFGQDKGRSKGFGFVIFPSEEEQKRAMQAVNGLEIDGRVLELKIAIDEPPRAEAPHAETGIAVDTPEPIIVAS